MYFNEYVMKYLRVHAIFAGVHAKTPTILTDESFGESSYFHLFVHWELWEFWPVYKIIVRESSDRNPICCISKYLYDFSISAF